MGIVRFLSLLLFGFVFFYRETGARMYDDDVYEKARSFIDVGSRQSSTGFSYYSDENEEGSADYYDTDDGYQQNEEELLKNKAREYLNTELKRGSRGNYINGYDDDTYNDAYDGGNYIDSYDDDTYNDAYDGGNYIDSYDDDTYNDAYDGGNYIDGYDAYDGESYTDDDYAYYETYDDGEYDSERDFGERTDDFSEEFDSENIDKKNIILKRGIKFRIDLSGFLKNDDEELAESSDDEVISDGLQEVDTEQKQTSQTSTSKDADQNASIQKALSENQSNIQNNQNKIKEQEETLQQLIQVISLLQQKLDQTSKKTSDQTKITDEQISDDDVIRKERIKIVEETVNDLRSRGILDEQKIKQLQFLAAGGGICSGCGKLEILTKLEGFDVGFCQTCLGKLKKQQVEFSKDVCIICKHHTSVKKLEGEFNVGVCSNCYDKFKSSKASGLSRFDNGVNLDNLGNQDLSALIQGATKEMGLNGEASALLGEIFSKSMSDKSDSSGKASNQAMSSGSINGSPNATTNKLSQQTMVFNEKGELVPLSTLKGTAAEFGYIKDANGKWVPAKSLDEATAAVKAATANGNFSTSSNNPEQMVFNEKGEVVPLSSLGGKKGYIKDANGNWVEAGSVEESAAAVKDAINKGEVLTDKNGKLVQASTLKDEAPYGYKKDEKGNWVKAESLQEGIAASSGTLEALAASIGSMIATVANTASSLEASINALKRSRSESDLRGSSLDSSMNTLKRSKSESDSKTEQKRKNQLTKIQDKLKIAKDKLEGFKGELREAEAAVSKASNEKTKNAAQKQVNKTKDQINKQEQTVRDLEEQIKKLEQ